MSLKKKKSNFTLLEICVCVAVLATAAVTIGWQMKSMLASHHFHQNVSHLITDLKKCQLFALADRIDVEVKISKSKGGFAYTLETDEPKVEFSKRPKRMEGVKTIFEGKKEIETLTIPIYSSGRIDQLEKIRLYLDEEKGVELDFSTPHLIAKRNL